MELKRRLKKSINGDVVFMQKNKKRAYPAFIREDGGIQLVYVPDFAIFTEGHDRKSIRGRREGIAGTVRL